MSQAILQGKSTPKVVRVNASDQFATFFKNLGNGRRVPTLWAETVTLASGTQELVVASGVSFNDFDAAQAKWQVTPVFTTGSGLTYNTGLLGTVYIEKDEDANVVTLKSTVSGGLTDDDTDWDVYVFMGDDTHYTVDHSNQIWQRLDQSSLRGKKV